MYPIHILLSTFWHGVYDEGRGKGATIVDSKKSAPLAWGKEEATDVESTSTNASLTLSLSSRESPESFLVLELD